MNATSRLFNRNFFLLWQGQFVSQLGSQAFAVAMMFWLKHKTGSASLMGLIMMVSMLPAVILGPVAGTVADRCSRRKIIIWSDVIKGVFVVLLALVVWVLPMGTDAAIALLFLVTLIVATVGTFFNPAITAAIPDIVPKDKLATANSVSESSRQVTMFIGQAVGGFLYLKLGAPLLFLINGLSYLFSAASEAFITIPQTLPENGGTWRDKFMEFKKDTLAGLHYAWRHPGLRALFVMASFINFFAVPLIVLLPFYVEDVLLVAADWYGYIMAGFGLGALVGYGVAGSVKTPPSARSAILLSTLILMACYLPLFSVVRDARVALGLMSFMGMLNGFFNISIITALQTSTPGEMRGRMFGLLMTLTSGLTPLSMGLAGVVADLLDQNIPLIYAICGVMTLIFAIATAFSRDLRTFLRQEPVSEPAQ